MPSHTGALFCPIVSPHDTTPLISILNLSEFPQRPSPPGRARGCCARRRSLINTSWDGLDKAVGTWDTEILHPGTKRFAEASIHDIPTAPHLKLSPRLVSAEGPTNTGPEGALGQDMHEALHTELCCPLPASKVCRDSGRASAPPLKHKHTRHVNSSFRKV